MWWQPPKQYKAEKRLENLIYIVYPYDTTDSKDPYTFISSSQITMSEAEIKSKKLPKLPPWVQREMNKSGGAKLSPLAQKEVRRYQEMQADLQVQRNQRRRGVLEYKEKYELLSWEGIAKSDLDKLDDDDENCQDDHANMQPSTIDEKEIE